MRASVTLVVLLAAACKAPTPIPVVSLGPDPADTRDDLVAQVENELLVGWTWEVDGEPADVIGPRVPASMTTRGQVWTVTGSVSGETGVERDEASVTIRNARPAVTLELAPEAPSAGDALVVARVAWDADGDPLEVVTRWYRNGELQEDLTGDQVPAERTGRGETWTVEVAASDGFGWSDTEVKSVTVANGAPELTAAAISPEPPRIADDLVAQVRWQDPDGDPLDIRYVWTINGTPVQDGTSPVLRSGEHEKGDVIRLLSGASDDGSVPEVTQVARTTVVNTVPGAPVARIVPNDPVAGDSLRCEPAGAPSDADGDAITSYKAGWTVDGVAYVGTTRTTWPGDTVPVDVTEGDEVWRCSLQAGDGEAYGSAGLSTVTVYPAGFRPSQTIGGRTVTCKSASSDSTTTTCIGLRVEGKAFPNGIGCSVGWSSAASPYTDHAAFCRLITGRSTFEADYTCGTLADRVTYVGGVWGTRSDNGLTESLVCDW